MMSKNTNTGQTRLSWTPQQLINNEPAGVALAVGQVRRPRASDTPCGPDTRNYSSFVLPHQSIIEEPKHSCITRLPY